jgi:hypothetical protein
MLEMKKKVQADQKRQQELEKKRKEEEKRKQEKEQKKEEKNIEVEAAKKKGAEQVVSGDAKLTKPAVMALVVSMQQVVQLAVKVRTSIEVAASSIEAVAPLVSMLFTSALILS